MKLFKVFLNSLLFLLRLSIVIVFCFFLFLAIPFLKNYSSIKDDSPKPVKRPVIVEYIKKPEKEKKARPQSRIRQVKSSPFRSAQRSLNFNFTPDFDIAENSDGVEMTSQDLDIVIFEEGEADENAVPVNRPQIPYPQRAKELGIEGDLVMVLVIGTDGKVVSVDVISSPDQSIAKAAVKNILSNWKFKPAINQGIPVKQKLKQKIAFRLNS